MRVRVSSFLAVACLASLAACDSRKPSTETFVWKGPMNRDALLRLRNVNGDFDIRQGTSDSAEIRLEIERSSEYAPSVQIKVLQLADGVIACALYGSNNSCSADGYEGGNTQTSHLLRWFRGSSNVHGTVLVPRGVRLDAESTNGDITVAAIGADLKLRTVNGDIQARGARRAVQISTTNGDVDLGVDSLGSMVKVQTTNGGVTLELPAALNAALTMETVNGDLDLGFPATIVTKSRRSLIATLGSGGAPISLSTTNGDITLRQRGAP